MRSTAVTPHLAITVTVSLPILTVMECDLDYHQNLMVSTTTTTTTMKKSAQRDANAACWL